MFVTLFKINSVYVNLILTLVSVEVMLITLLYRLGPINLNTVNSKFHLIQTFVKIFSTFLSFQS